MGTQNSINQDIISTISTINEDSPELNRHLDEMPIHYSKFPDSGISTSELNDYLNSLKKISQRYSKELD